jgi:hypothetical protein
MEIFNVTNKVNPLTQPIEDIKKMTKDKFSKGIPDFRMSVKVPRGLAHIDEVIAEIEATTNLLIDRSRIAGLGLDHKDNDFTYWTVRVWADT